MDRKKRDKPADLKGKILNLLPYIERNRRKERVEEKRIIRTMTQ